MTPKYLQIIPASLLATATSIATTIIAIAPTWASEKRLIILIAGASLVIAGLVSNAIHAHGTPKASTVAAEALNVVDAEVARLNFSQLAEDAVKAAQSGVTPADLEAKAAEAARAELRRWLADAARTPAATPSPAVPAPAAPAPQATTPLAAPQDPTGVA